MNFIKSKIKFCPVMLLMILVVTMSASARKKAPPPLIIPQSQLACFNEDIVSPTEWLPNDENVNILQVVQAVKGKYGDKLKRSDSHSYNNSHSVTFVLQTNPEEKPKKVLRIDLFEGSTVKTAKSGEEYIEKSHFHIFDANGTAVDKYGNITPPSSPNAHIPISHSFDSIKETVDLIGRSFESSIPRVKSVPSELGVDDLFGD